MKQTRTNKIGRNIRTQPYSFQTLPYTIWNITQTTYLYPKMKTDPKHPHTKQYSLSLSFFFLVVVFIPYNYTPLQNDPHSPIPVPNLPKHLLLLLPTEQMVLVVLFRHVVVSQPPFRTIPRFPLVYRRW